MLTESHKPTVLKCLTLQLFVTVLLHSFPIAISAQGEGSRWQRIYTGEHSLIEIDVSSLRFEPRHIRVVFRTILSKAESLGEKTAPKYKSRTEIILFDPKRMTHRFQEVRWLDANGNTVHSFYGTDADWKVLKQGGMMERMFDSIRTLAPFGNWKVVEYRLGENDQKETSDVRDLTRLIGKRVHLDVERAEVGTTVCQSPAYQSQQFTRQEFFRQLGIRAESINMDSNPIETIIVKCEGNGWAPPQSMLIKVGKDEMLMLWKGVFLVLDHRARLKNTSSSSLKRRLPQP